MPNYANIQTSTADDDAYCINAALPSSEADLNVPIQLTSWCRSILAVVQLSCQGFVSSNNSYIVMQTDLGDGAWVDLAWIFYNGSAAQIQAMSAGTAGAAAPGAQRGSGTAPASSPATVGLVLGSRIRFTGKGIQGSSGASGSSGQPNAIVATIKYKLLGQR